MSRHTCPACNRDIAAYPGVHGTPEKLYVYLRRHHRPDGRWCPDETATVAVKLRQRLLT